MVMRRFLSIALVLLSFTCFAATVTWDGGAGTPNWGDAANWDTNTLPGISDDVVINNDSVVFNLNTTIESLLLNSAVLDLVSGSDSLIVTGNGGTGIRLMNNSKLKIDRPLKVQNVSLDGVYMTDSFLAVYKFGSLSIDQAGGNGINLDINSSIYNEKGHIYVSNTFSLGVLNIGGITNTGGLEVFDCGSSGIKNDGNLLNSGQISLEDNGSAGLMNNGYFENQGTVTIQNDHINNSNASAQLINSGLISFSASGNVNFFLDNSAGSFVNQSSGTIDMLTKGAYPLENDSYFVNHGTINVEEAQINCLMNFSGSEFLNYGTLNLKKSGIRGIDNSGATSRFVNMSSGIVNIDSCDYGIFNEGHFKNQGELNLRSGVADFAVDHASISDSLINSGDINCTGGKFNNRGFLLNQNGGRIALFNELFISDYLENRGHISSRFAPDHAVKLIDTLENHGTMSFAAPAQNGIYCPSINDGFIDNRAGASLILSSSTYTGLSGNIYLKNAGTFKVLSPGLDGVNLSGTQIGFENSGLIEINNTSGYGVRMYGTVSEVFKNSSGGLIQIENCTDDGINIGKQFSVVANFENFGELRISNVDGDGINSTLDSLINKSVIAIEYCSGSGLNSPFIQNYALAEISVDSAGVYGLSSKCLNSGNISTYRTGQGLNLPELDNFGNILLDGSAQKGLQFLSNNGFLHNHLGSQLAVKNCSGDGILLYNRLINHGVLEIDGATNGLKITNQTFSDSLINTGDLIIKNCSEYGIFSAFGTQMVARNREQGLIRITNTSGPSIAFSSSSQLINETCASIIVDGDIGSFTNYGFVSTSHDSPFTFYEFFNHGIFEDQEAQLVFDNDFHNTGIVIQPVRGTPSPMVNEHNVISTASFIFTKNYSLYANQNKTGIIGEFDYVNEVVRFQQNGLAEDTAYMFYDWANCGEEKMLTIPIRQNHDCGGQFTSASFGDNVLPTSNWFEPTNWDTKQVPDGCTDVTLHSGRPEIPAGAKARVHFINADQQFGANFLNIPASTVFESGD